MGFWKDLLPLSNIASNQANQKANAVKKIEQLEQQLRELEKSNQELTEKVNRIDRMLISQAINNDLTIVTTDSKFSDYEVKLV